MTIHRNRIAALGVAGAITIAFAASIGPVFAAPVSSSTAALKQADVSNVIDAQWRRRRNIARRNIAPLVAGTALGIIGGIIAAEMYQDRYYDGYVYDNGYAYGPYPYGTPYPTQRYYRGYAPYAPSTDCINRPETCW